LHALKNKAGHFADIKSTTIEDSH